MAEFVVELAKQPGASDADCERFFKCLSDRIEKGPPEHREPTEADRLRVDISGSFQGLNIYGCSSHEDARRFVADAAAMCGLDWEKLYRIR